MIPRRTHHRFQRRKKHPPDGERSKVNACAFHFMFVFSQLTFKCHIVSIVLFVLSIYAMIVSDLISKVKPQPKLVKRAHAKGDASKTKEPGQPTSSNVDSPGSHVNED